VERKSDLDRQVKQLLAVDGVDVNSKARDGNTALSYAAQNRDDAVYKLLLATEGAIAYLGEVFLSSKALRY